MKINFSHTTGQADPGNCSPITKAVFHVQHVYFSYQINTFFKHDLRSPSQYLQYWRLDDKFYRLFVNLSRFTAKKNNLAKLKTFVVSR